MLNVQRIRQDFPILKSGIIYLDNAASSLTPEPVLEKMLEFYREYRANIGRGVHRLAQRASEEYESARRKVANFINAQPYELIMTRNATEGINIVASGLKWRRNDKIVTSIIEHHSNFIVWLRVKKKYGVSVEVVKPTESLEEGLFNLSDFEKAIDDNTRIVAVTHVSNVLGVIMPVKELAEMAHEHDALLLVDGAQSVPHMKIDVKEIDCDFLAFSGHKMCAPTGSGALYMKEKYLSEIEPLCIGGGTIVDVDLDDYQLEEGPQRFEGGTPAIGDIVGFGAAVEYLKKIGMENIQKHEAELTKKIYKDLSTIQGIEVYGPKPKYKAGITSFNIKGLNPHDVAVTLDLSAKIILRSGHHCALPATKNIICQSGSVRASTYLYNTKEEVERLISAIDELSKKVRN